MKIVRYFVLFLLHVLVTSHVIRTGSNFHVFEPAKAADQPCCPEGERGQLSDKLVGHEGCETEELTSATRFDKRNRYRALASQSRNFSSLFFAALFSSLGDFSSRPFKPPQIFSA